jgi:hypothetical protein
MTVVNSAGVLTAHEIASVLRRLKPIDPPAHRVWFRTVSAFAEELAAHNKFDQQRFFDNAGVPR